MKNILKYILPSLIIGVGIGWLVAAKFFPERETMESTHQHNTSDGNREDMIFTCSMHPQIRQPEPGICPICEMDLIPLQENSSNDPMVLQMTEAAVKLANIQTYRVGSASGEEAELVRLSGKIAVDESRMASQVTHLPGRIEKLYVRFTGAPIRQGQKLADIYAPDLITAQKELLEAKKLTQFNPELVEAARQKLRYWKMSAQQIEEIEKSGTIQDVFSIYADANGIVTQPQVKVGDYVKQGAVLYDLVDLKTVWALFDVYERDLASFRVGTPITFTTSTWPGREFTGKVSFIDPLIDPASRVARLRVEVINNNGALKPGMLITGSANKALSGKSNLMVPKSAVLWTGKRSVVYVAVPDATVPSYQFREVELGEALGNFYQVQNGLAAGEEVVTQGAFSIDAAAQLNNQASMMNRNVMIKGQEKPSTLPDYSAEAPAAFKAELEALMEAYLSVKDAFVATDSLSAVTATKDFLRKLNKTDASILSEPAKSYWEEKSQAMVDHLEKLAAAVEVEAQRQQFSFLSDQWIEVVQAMGHSDGVWYVQHCPMAFDDTGADWISAEEEIRNPYFGDKMLKCGTVELVLD